MSNDIPGENLEVNSWWNFRKGAPRENLGAIPLEPGRNRNQWKSLTLEEFLEEGDSRNSLYGQHDLVRLMSATSNEVFHLYDLKLVCVNSPATIRALAMQDRFKVLWARIGIYRNSTEELPHKIRKFSSNSRNYRWMKLSRKFHKKSMEEFFEKSLRKF